jgi:elongation factor 1 alpha-like protein
MQRVKNIDYDDDELYDDEDEQYEEDGYTDEDRNNFATLTPVVQAELDEAGLQASNKEIEDALWHYYWDVGKSVAYLKNTRTPRTDTPKKGKAKGEQKAKSKFDQAAERSAAATGELPVILSCKHGGGCCEPDPDKSCLERRGGSRHPKCILISNSSFTEQPLPIPGSDWFSGVPWSNVPPEMEGNIVPLYPDALRPLLLGGSSKLAKLAEERRKKAAAASSPVPAPDGALTSLDRLSKPKDPKENVKPPTKAEPKKYPIRKKSEPAPPPPKEPPPPPIDPKDELPDLRASPTAFGRTLSSSPPQSSKADTALRDLLGSISEQDPFKGPSPDDAVLRAQQNSKGLQ